MEQLKNFIANRKENQVQSRGYAPTQVGLTNNTNSSTSIADLFADIKAKKEQSAVNKIGTS